MSAKILIVDDDPRLSTLYRETLTMQGYQTFAAGNGEEALATITKEKPDLILLDIMMPKVQGVDTLDIIKATPEYKDTKVIVFSAISDERVKERALELGAADYIVKSQTTINDVVSRVEQVLNS